MIAYPDLMREEVRAPAAVLADKGCDSDAIRADLERRGVEPVIPTKSNRKARRDINKAIYALRNRIERFFNKPKPSRRVAARHDKLAYSFLGFVQIAATGSWIRFVRAA